MVSVRKQKPVLIVLSGGLTKKGRIPFFVKNRLDHAYKIYIQGIAKKIIVSGKWSYLYTDQPKKTEATAMAEYLVSLGVDLNDIITEPYSQDLISSVYYVKEKVLNPQKIQIIKVISSDFQEERVKYLFNKILGREYRITYDFTPSQLKSQMLWQFYRYESTALVNSKKFLHKMKSGDHSFLKGKFYDSQFYKLQKVGFTKSLAREGEITRRRDAALHYSLKQIYNKRNEIFDNYGIVGQKKTLKADFWSGVFLNFLGKDANNDLFCLKFVLYVRDKAAFLNEVKVTKFLTVQGIDFVPKVLDSTIEKAPYWYLYKVVHGRMAGEFSLRFSYDASFFKAQFPSLLSSHLKTLRSIDIVQLNPIICGTNWHKNNAKNRLKVIEQDTKIEEKYPIIRKAHELLLRSVSVFDKYARYPAHNDLHPANIIVASSRTIYFIDFERIGYNTIATDFARIYSLSWPNPDFQLKLYASFIKTLTDNEKKEFAEIFPYSYINILLLLFKYTIQWKYLSDNEYRKRAQYFVAKELEKAIDAINNATDFFG